MAASAAAPLLLAALVGISLAELDTCQFFTRVAIGATVGVVVHTLETAVTAARQVRQASAGDCAAATLLWATLLLLSGREDAALCGYHAASQSWFGSAVVWVPARLSWNGILAMLPLRIRRAFPATTGGSLDILGICRGWRNTRVRALLVRISAPRQPRRWAWVDASEEHSLEALFAHLDGDGSGALEPREARHLTRVFPAVAGEDRRNHMSASEGAFGPPERAALPHRVESVATLATLFAQRTGADLVGSGPLFGRYLCTTDRHGRGRPTDGRAAAEPVGPVCAAEAISSVDRIGLLAVPLVASPICILGPSSASTSHFQPSAFAHAHPGTTGAIASLGSCIYVAAIMLAAASMGWRSRRGASLRRAALRGLRAAVPNSRPGERHLMRTFEEAAARRAAFYSACIGGLVLSSLEAQVYRAFLHAAFHLP
jgi:hypothetical protein